MHSLITISDCIIFSCGVQNDYPHRNLVKGWVKGGCKIFTCIGEETLINSSSNCKNVWGGCYGQVASIQMVLRWNMDTPHHAQVQAAVNDIGKSHFSSLATKFNVQHSTFKIMATVFLVSKGIILLDIWPRAYCINVYDTAKHWINSKEYLPQATRTFETECHTTAGQCNTAYSNKDQRLVCSQQFGDFALSTT